MGNYINQSLQYGNIEVVEVKSGEFQKSNTKTAVLRQSVTILSVYEGAKHSNNMQDNIFSASEFGDEEKIYTTVQTRVAFMEVPANATVEQVKEKLSKLPNACLYKIYSNRPILHEGHKSALSSGLTTFDKIAKGQVLRYGAEHANAGELILQNGKVQYGKTFISTTQKPDMDLRGLAEYPEYISAEIAEEMGVEAEGAEEFEISDQTIE